LPQLVPRKRAPIALAAVDGRSLDKDPPTLPPDDDRPSPPPWLTPLARKEWDRIEQTLWAMGCLTEIDQGMFAAYCQAWGRYEQAEIDLNAFIAAGGMRTKRPRKPKGAPKNWKPPATHGAVEVTAAGNKIVNPLFGLVNTLRRDMQRLASEFGLSPSARAALGGKGGGGKVQDPIAEKYFGGNGG
jgi:P27 family predicted phage terminase small subunit